MKRGDVRKLKRVMYIRGPLSSILAGNEGDTALVLGDWPERSIFDDVDDDPDNPEFDLIKVLVNGYIGPIFRCNLGQLSARAKKVL